MNRISPVWILTSLEGEELDKFRNAIDQQFKAFSETELVGFAGGGTHQWWGVETTAGGLVYKWNRGTGYPNNIPAFLPGTFPLFDGNQGIVIYYSPLGKFMEDIPIIDGLRSDPIFLPTLRQGLFFYGLTSFHNNETTSNGFLDLVREIETTEQYRPFDSVTFLSDSSNCARNPNGYLSLNDEDFLSLVVNAIFTIAITKRSLHQFNNNVGSRFNTAGVFSFIYEPDALKKSKAFHLSEQLLNDFCNNKQNDEWYNQNDAHTHFDGPLFFGFKQKLHWNNIYKLLSQGFEEESMKGLYSQSEISPWRMFAYKLVPAYFRKYVKSLVRKTHDNVHDFSTLTTMRYESFAKNKCTQMLEGTAEITDKHQYAKSAIASYLSSVWDPNYEGAKGVQQVLLLLEKTKKYLEKQKEEVGRVKSFNDPNDDKYKGFPKMEDYPLKEIFKKENKMFLEHYNKFVTDGKPSSENTTDADKTYEERQLTKIHKSLQWHAMPLNLFTKAGLLSALIFIAIWALISIIQSTEKVHIFSLETNQSLISLYSASAIIVLTFAFAKYGLKTLRKIRLALWEYIAWSYYKVQGKVYDISLQEEIEYYNEMLNECARIKSQIDTFVNLEMQEQPSFGKYYTSKFQRNILENMDDGNQILANTALNVSLQINGMEYSTDVVTQGLFDAMLKANDQQLNEKMRDCLLNETDKERRNKLKEELLNIWSNTLTENINIAINGGFGNAIDYPAFHNTQNSNFNLNALQSANGIIHPSVYVDAMRPSSCVFSIVPNGNGHTNGYRWENLFYGPNDVNRKIPNFAQNINPVGWLTTEKIALFMRVHTYDNLIVNDRNRETTIFNNQL